MQNTPTGDVELRIQNKIKTFNNISLVIG